IMKKTLLFMFLLVFYISAIAQTQTYNLNWFAGIGSNVDLTIETGDTVIWTWTSPNHSVENDPAGTSVETFNSGVLAANGSTFSYTFANLGTNDYYCGVHGAASMSGTITVVAEGTLSTPQFETPRSFSMHPNPGRFSLEVDVPSVTTDGLLFEVFDILGKRIHKQRLTKLKSTIGISTWESGVYLVRVSDSKQSVSLTKRFVKM
ncbi:MAG: T9SS type A sorting domain-containing protein, partial [Bizionia paragorgiae]|uniref:T9SS type A sorting domain-containing protein n=2 Tax=Bizionia paragorgiae TaxID=283786 RepID=UPI003C5F587D